MDAKDQVDRMDPTTLARALAHLRDFRATLYDGDDVDPDSHLHATDLDIVIAAAERQLAADCAAGETALGDGDGADR